MADPQNIPEQRAVTPVLSDPIGTNTVPDNGKFQPLVDYCNKLKDQFENSKYRKEKIQEIEDSCRVYEQKSDKDDWPWENASNIVLPLTTITVDNIEPRLVAGMIGKEPICSFEMLGQTEKDDITKLLEDWFNKTLKNEVYIQNRTNTIVHTLLKEGTYYSIPQYDIQKSIKRDFVYNEVGQIIVDPQTGIAKTQDAEVTNREGVEVQTIPFTDILCADNLGTLDEWEKADKGRIIRPTYAELQRDKLNQGYISDRIGTWLIGQKEDKLKEPSPDQKVVGVEVTGKEVIECVEWYISYFTRKNEEATEEEQDNFEEDRIVATIATRTNTLIRLRYQRDIRYDNSSIINRIRLFPEEGRSYGTSIYGKLKSVQNGASDFFNSVLNAAYICMIPWFFYEEASGIPNDMEIEPGKGVPVDSVKGILFPNFSVQPQVYISFIEMFMQLWERIGSIANPQMGRPDDAKKTATEIMMVVQEGNIKFDYQSQSTRDEFISFLRSIYDLYYQHMPYNYMHVYNGQPTLIPRKEMKRNFKFVLTGSTATANKMLERKEAEDIYQIGSQNPLANPLPFFEDLLKAHGKTNLKRYVNPQAQQMLMALATNPELPQVVSQYLSTKQEITGEVGGVPNTPAAKRLNTTIKNKTSVPVA
jgi:hypothetical protein